jgi:hypothetical protein
MLPRISWFMPRIPSFIPFRVSAPGRLNVATPREPDAMDETSRPFAPRIAFTLAIPVRGPINDRSISV